MSHDPELLLTALDEYPYHQTMAPFPMPSTSDTHFNDGYYFGFYGPGAFAYFGMRLYPNTNVIDGYAGIVIDGVQRTIRASRVLRPRVNELEVGPLQLELTDPMKTVRLILADNDEGVSFDVTLEGSARPFFESPDIHYRRGRLLNHVLRYTQMCRTDGTVTVDGEQTAVDRWYGCRDHSWGIRASMGPHVALRGVEPSVGDPRAIRIWLPFEVEGESGLASRQVGMFALHEDSDGRQLDFDGVLIEGDGEEQLIVSAKHAFVYTPGTRRLERGEFSITTEAGVRHEYAFEVVAGPLSPQGFGYVRGWQNGQPPGTWRGEAHVEFDRFRVDDPTTVAGPDHVEPSRRLGVTEYPSTLRHADGRAGMTQIEHAVYKAYRPYGLV
jgi:hypothetical protein